MKQFRVSLFVLIVIFLLATAGVTIAATSLHYDQRSSVERLEMALSSAFGSQTALWAYGSQNVSDFKELGRKTEELNNERYHAKLSPKPSTIKTRSQAIAALSQYDKAFVKKMKPTCYKTYRISIATEAIYWTCLTYDKRRTEAISAQDAQLIKSSLASLIVDAKAIGVPANMMAALEQHRDDGLKAKTGGELIRACIMISSWNTMLCSIIGDVTPYQ